MANGLFISKGNRPTKRNTGRRKTAAHSMLLKMREPEQRFLNGAPKTGWSLRRNCESRKGEKES
jgi:hypothetical protein